MELPGLWRIACRSSKENTTITTIHHGGTMSSTRFRRSSLRHRLPPHQILQEQLHRGLRSTNSYKPRTRPEQIRLIGPINRIIRRVQHSAILPLVI